MTERKQDDLGSLKDKEVVEDIFDNIYDGLSDEVVKGVKVLIDRGWTATDVLAKALVEGMGEVGVDFRDGILFVPEVLLSAKAMKAGISLIKPLLSDGDYITMGRVLIGTVHGDIHDIGKNLVGMMMEGAGFEVIDIGINLPVEKYLEAIEEHRPDILGLSALLTTTMPYMGTVIEALVKKGIRNELIVLVGGAPLNEAFSDKVGADAYCRDASMAVETAKALMAQRQGSLAAATASK